MPLSRLAIQSAKLQAKPYKLYAEKGFVPFFYGEAEAQLRLQNNVYLDDGEGLYSGESDRLSI